MKSQKNYMNALQTCDKLRDCLSEREVLEMRARLYLNIGLMYEKKQDLKEAIKFVQKALVITK